LIVVYSTKSARSLWGPAVRYSVLVIGEVYSFGAASLDEAQQLATFIRKDGRSVEIVDTHTGLTVDAGAKHASASRGRAVRFTPPPWNS
jgi:hypothetical protein